MKKLVTIILSLAWILVAVDYSVAQTPIPFDTLYHAQVGPGMYQTEYNFRTVPWRVHVLRIELGQPNLKFRTVKADDYMYGTETPSSMRERLQQKEGAYVVAGINGDFYSGGKPSNTQVIDGTMLKKPHSTREALLFDESYNPWIAGNLSFSGSVKGTGFTESISVLNESRPANSVAAYNSYIGSSTGTNAYGTEIALKLEGESLVNEPASYVVTRIEENVGDMSFNNNEDIILSIHGTPLNSFSSVAVNDTLELEFDLQPLTQKIKEAIGGNGQFVKNGVVNSNWEVRHPRTAVGFTQDTTQIFFVVVEGRYSLSKGMMLSELGDFMTRIGVSEAINLDGGGSSSLLIQDELVNHPSDGTERATANGLFVMMPDPGTSQTSHIKLDPGFSKVFLGKSADFMVREFDQNFRQNLLDVSEIQFSVDAHLGTISNSGTFTANLESGSGYIYAQYGTFKDSAKIEVLGMRSFSLSPEQTNLRLDMDLTPSFSIRDDDGLAQDLPRTSINWSVTNGEVGTIDAEGKFTATSVGQTGIVASLDNMQDTTWVEVASTEGYNQITDFSSKENWTITTEHLDKENVNLIELEDGLEVQFSYPSQYENAQIVLSNDYGIPGAPQFLDIVISGDGEKYIMSLDIESSSGGRFTMAPPMYADFENPEAMHFPFLESMTTRISGNGFFFPFTFKSINLTLPKNNTGSEVDGYFRLHKLGVTYDDTPTNTELKEEDTQPNQFTLRQNYPNPFNPTTSIQFELPSNGFTTLKVYDMLGREVSTLINKNLTMGVHSVNFDASTLSSGVYIYRLEMGSQSITRKMTLIK